MVWQVVGAVRIPVVGIGGIATAQDALEFLMAGARAVQVGTACFANPRAPLEIIAGIRQFMVENGIRRVTELIGAARPAGEAALGNLPPLGDAGADGRLQPLQPGPGPRGGAGEALRQWLKDADRA
ncbi:MAG: hypothetical protein DIU70_011135, partial [Bacillota bacterium]